MVNTMLTDVISPVTTRYVRTLDPRYLYSMSDPTQYSILQIQTHSRGIPQMPQRYSYFTWVLRKESCARTTIRYVLTYFVWRKTDPPSFTRPLQPQRGVLWAREQWPPRRLYPSVDRKDSSRILVEWGGVRWLETGEGSFSWQWRLLTELF